jgi:hypothetical protein
LSCPAGGATAIFERGGLNQVGMKDSEPVGSKHGERPRHGSSASTNPDRIGGYRVDKLGLDRPATANLVDKAISKPGTAR